jgi:SMC interacting uncharacterized protein involved in chromosome segregation
MTDVDPEKATIGDLFRLMTAMNKKLDSQSETLDEHTETLAQHSAKLEAHTGELEGIRTVVDTLPSYEMVENIETAQNRMVEDLASARSSQQKATTFQRQTVSRLDRVEAGQEKIVKSLDKAGIPVR